MDEGTGLTLPLAESLTGTALWGSGCWHAPATPWSQSQLWRPFVLKAVCLLLLTPARARCCNCSFYPTLTPPLLVTLTTLVACSMVWWCRLCPATLSVGPAMDQTKGCVNEQELAATSLVRTETVELTEWACSVHTTVPKRPLTKRIF